MFLSQDDTAHNSSTVGAQRLDESEVFIANSSFVANDSGLPDGGRLDTSHVSVVHVGEENVSFNLHHRRDSGLYTRVSLELNRQFAILILILSFVSFS